MDITQPNGATSLIWWFKKHFIVLPATDWRAGCVLSWSPNEKVKVSYGRTQKCFPEDFSNVFVVIERKRVVEEFGSAEVKSIKTTFQKFLIFALKIVKQMAAPKLLRATCELAIIVEVPTS